MNPINFQPTASAYCSSRDFCPIWIEGALLAIKLVVQDVITTREADNLSFACQSQHMSSLELRMPIDVNQQRNFCHLRQKAILIPPLLSSLVAFINSS